MFLQEVVSKFRHTIHTKPFAVIDGHSSHLTKKTVKFIEAYFTVLRIPPRSCQFNSAERVFAHFKRNLVKVMAGEPPTS